LLIIGAAIAALVYVLYKNIHGVAYPYKWFPYVVLGWLFSARRSSPWPPGLPAHG